MASFPPVPAMFAIDCAMIAAAVGLSVLCYVKRRRIRDAGGGRGITLLLAGFLTVASLYVLDLFTMTILPAMAGPDTARRVMTALHLNYSWYIHVVAVLLILAGIYVCIDAFARQVRRVELARVEAEDADRAKSAFLAAMSHELRTPLNAILGFSEFMGMESVVQQPERCREYAGNIHASGQHLSSLVNDLLDLARIEEGRLDLRLEPIALGPVMDEALRMMATDAARAGVGLKADVTRDLPLLHADRRSVRQIVLNLLSNAIRHTPTGGQVTVTACQQGPDICITVSDTGEGIPTEMMEQLFDPYVTRNPLTKEEKRGSGLGLAISQRLVRAHGGYIRMESAVGSGTKATVVFPKAILSDVKAA